MNSLSYWASRHRRAAIALIVLLETIKVASGMDVGRYGLPALSPDVLTYLTLAVAAAIFTVRRRHEWAKEAGGLTRSRMRRDLLLVFQGGFLLSILAGNACQNFYGDPGSYSLWSAQSLEMRRDTISPEPRLRGSDLEQMIGNPPQRKGWGWRVAGYALLFLLGVAAAGFALVLACALSCAGQEVLALLALFGVTGSYVALLVLLPRAWRKPPKRFRDMTRNDYRREVKTLFLGLSLAALILVLTMVIAGITTP